MLTNLHVKNIALIDEVDVAFSPGLNILTGETGAGKSIILGTVNLALGAKMDSGIIGNFGDNALVELIFQVENNNIRDFLKMRDIELEEGQIIISRKLMEGRSICKINGETCTIGQMKEVTSLLLDIHGQHEHQKLLNKEKQLEILDDFGGIEIKPIKQKVRAVYDAYKNIQKQLEGYNLNKEQRIREISFLEFEINEIEEAQLKPHEDEILEKEYKKLSNSKKITDALQSVHNLTGYEGGMQAGEIISRAIRELNSIQGYDEALDNMNAMILDIESMLNDFNREVSSYLSDLTYSEESFYEIEQRLDQLNRLKAKYGNSIEAICTYQAEQHQKLEELQNFEAKKAELEDFLSQKEKELELLCSQLRAVRKKYALNFRDALMESLRDLNFSDVNFKIIFNEQYNFSNNGKDTIEFLISTNPGEVVKPLNKVVSGGELSRIMLAVKTLMADQEDAQTQIFDEIDAGISGRTAQKVSEKMAKIAKTRQILCITHLPQIAAMADRHFEIRKKICANVTTTQIYHMTEEESTREIARILGGAKITQRTLDTAREMKDLAQVHKNTRLKK